MNIRQFVLDRLAEASTWRGIILVLTSAGVHVAPQWNDSIISIGIGLAGIVGVVTADKKAQ